MPQTLRVLAIAAVVGALASTAALAPASPFPAPAPTGLPADLAEATAPAAGTTADTYDWPVTPAAVVRPFDDPAEPWLPGHRGVDLAGVVGGTVHAAADGVVAFAGSVAGKPVVSIDHADGIRTTYEPVLAVVVLGQGVSRGEAIGTLAAGHGTGSDLHWGARRGPRTYVDPTLLVAIEAVIRLWE